MLCSYCRLGWIEECLGGLVTHTLGIHLESVARDSSIMVNLSMGSWYDDTPENWSKAGGRDWLEKNALGCMSYRHYITLWPILGFSFSASCLPCCDLLSHTSSVRMG